jgi:hypothetical protein
LLLAEEVHNPGPQPCDTLDTVPLPVGHRDLQVPSLRHMGPCCSSPLAGYVSVPTSVCLCGVCGVAVGDDDGTVTLGGPSWSAVGDLFVVVGGGDDSDQVLLLFLLQSERS